MYLTAVLVAFTRTEAIRLRQLGLAAGGGYALSVIVRLLANGSTTALWGELLQCAGVIGMLAILGRRARQFENDRQGLSEQVDKLQQEVERVTRNAERDHLTKSFNRQYIMEALLREKARADRTGRCFSVCIFDLDRFKSLNDQHGHLVGDRVLAVFANRARRALRSMDSINPTRFRRALGRLGGEEFIAVLPGTEIDGALRCAERVREAVARHPVEQQSANHRLGRCRRIPAWRKHPGTSHPGRPGDVCRQAQWPQSRPRQRRAAREAERRRPAQAEPAGRALAAHLPIQNELKIRPRRSSLVNWPVISGQRVLNLQQLLRHQLAGLPLLELLACGVEMPACGLQAVEVAAPGGDQAFFARVKAGDFPDALPQLLQTCASQSRNVDDGIVGRCESRRLAGQINLVSHDGPAQGRR